MSGSALAAERFRAEDLAEPIVFGAEDVPEAAAASHRHPPAAAREDE